MELLQPVMSRLIPVLMHNMVRGRETWVVEQTGGGGALRGAG